MAALSVAQCLPDHIVEAIVLWLAPGRYMRTELSSSSQPFIWPAGVCRSWRSAVMPLLCRSVALDVNWHYESRHVWTLRDAVDCGCQRHIRHIVVRIGAFDVSSPWEEQRADTASFLQGCGQLAAVHSLSFDIVLLLGDAYLWKPMDERTGPLLRRTVDEACALIKVVAEKMPNIRHVAIGDRHRIEYTRDVQLYFAEDLRRLLDSQHSVLGARTKHISLTGTDDGGELQAPIPAGSLRSLTIAEGDGHGRVGELIRRNSATLERLSFEHFDQDDALALFFGTGDDAQRPVVYPVLRRLIVSNLFEDDDSRKRPVEPAANPFPALEELQCLVMRVFPVATVLLGCRMRVRRVETLISDDALVSLVNRVLMVDDGDGFPRLEYAMLGTHGHEESDQTTDALLLRLTGLFSRAHTLQVMRSHRQLVTDKFGALLRLSPHLQSLDMRPLGLTAGQMLSVLRGYPRLCRLGISLVEFPDAADRATPTAELIGEYQERYQTHGMWHVWTI
ncbi:hypothetical protein H4R18_003163 [Coemansia javaensis]|uniref:Uncharacterized protein n=1 Tax=Coemansia javaensis TaxID=2761396 RepID=A0A9W8HGB3_9FUNG|nr:hypothetical protein H4R18_003163 [Coemansia javaensis]